AERAAELKQDAREALLEVVKPAYERVVAFTESELPKAAVNPSGVGQTHPDGAAYYAYQLKRNTSTDMTAGQIHELGLSEVKRLRGELAKVQERIGFEGDLQAFFKHMQDDPARLFPNTDAGRQAYIDEATEVIDNIKQHLPEYFCQLHTTDLDISRIAPLRDLD